MRISDWSSYVCSSDLRCARFFLRALLLLGGRIIVRPRGLPPFLDEIDDQPRTDLQQRRGAARLQPFGRIVAAPKHFMAEMRGKKQQARTDPAFPRPSPATQQPVHRPHPRLARQLPRLVADATKKP